ncbi:MAG: AIR synthase-related protein, partial [Actinomycetota bacterium]
IGMIAVVAPADEAAALAALAERGVGAWVIGTIEAGAGVRYAG